MSGESIVPACGLILVLGGEGCHLTGVHLLEEAPDIVQRAHEQDISVNVQQRVCVRQQILEKNE